MRPLKFTQGSVTGSASTPILTTSATQYVTIKSANINLVDSAVANAILYEFGTGSRVILQAICGSGANQAALNCGDSDIYLGTGSDVYLATDSATGKSGATIVYELR